LNGAQRLNDWNVWNGAIPMPNGETRGFDDLQKPACPLFRFLLLEFAGAIYHLTNRGNDRQKVFSTDAGRELFLKALARVVRRFG
jgi:hypothetical protein